MSTDEMLSKLLPLFEDYYNVNTENVCEPFAAEAVFQSHNEQYYLIKAAKVADVDMNEYVYFVKCDTLTASSFTEYDRLAWERGLAMAKPGHGHRSTDVALFIVSDDIDEEAIRLIKKTRHYKSYRFGFHGWSNYRLVAIGCSKSKAYYNHQGKSFKKLVRNIL